MAIQFQRQPMQLMNFGAIQQQFAPQERRGFSLSPAELLSYKKIFEANAAQQQQQPAAPLPQQFRRFAPQVPGIPDQSNNIMNIVNSVIRGLR
jgi:hypothetical protein